MTLSRLALWEHSQEIKFAAMMEWDKRAFAVIPCSHIPHTGLRNSWTHSPDWKIIRSSHSVITAMVVPKGTLAKSLLTRVPETQLPPFTVLFLFFTSISSKPICRAWGMLSRKPIMILGVLEKIKCPKLACHDSCHFKGHSWVSWLDVFQTFV